MLKSAKATKGVSAEPVNREIGDISQSPKKHDRDGASESGDKDSANDSVNSIKDGSKDSSDDSSDEGSDSSSSSSDISAKGAKVGKHKNTTKRNKMIRQSLEKAIKSFEGNALSYDKLIVNAFVMSLKAALIANGILLKESDAVLFMKSKLGGEALNWVSLLERKQRKAEKKAHVKQAASMINKLFFWIKAIKDRCIKKKDPEVIRN